MQPAATGQTLAAVDPLGIEAGLRQLIDWLKLFFWALVALFVLALLWMAFSGSH